MEVKICITVDNIPELRLSMQEAITLRNKLTEQINALQTPVAQKVNFYVPTKEQEEEIQRRKEEIKKLQEDGSERSY